MINKNKVSIVFVIKVLFLCTAVTGEPMKCALNIGSNWQIKVNIFAYFCQNLIE